MPTYANKDGKVVRFFRDTQEGDITLGFSQEANLDDGRIWPIPFALTHLTVADEAAIVELVKRAVR